MDIFGILECWLLKNSDGGDLVVKVINDGG